MTSRQSRRAFLRDGSLILFGTGVNWSAASGLLADGAFPKPQIRIGMITDLHYADKPPAGSRYYRETLDKLSEAVQRFQTHSPDFVVELGDFIDAADSVSAEKSYLRRINREFSAICDDRHYVLGNHCVYTLTKNEFLEGVERERSYHSFDRNGFHFVVLDSCFRSDGAPYGRKNFEWTDPNIPDAELEWLQADLKGTDKPVIVFAHQRLDVTNHHGVKNAVPVRRLLEASGRVLAVFQGHSHKNDHTEIAGIHYCTLVAMVEGTGAENNGYSLLEIAGDGVMRVRGFRKQQTFEWPSGGGSVQK